ncbi:hypothetical protein VM1G_01615 [Cytospora mali]|uniref:Uncharacterized protein n=1 Tax=Cytospora mali TaxID=578113 RepID=A0A194VQN1_CYTMA|nr:hypothetical protein VM1G_01615 [Valsa mali]
MSPPNWSGSDVHLRARFKRTRDNRSLNSSAFTSHLTIPHITAAKMAARLFTSSARALASTNIAPGATRSFQTTARRLYADAAPLPARKPMGAFRGGLFGFLLGATLAGSGTYYYVLQDYKASNELLQDDIYALQAATQRMSNYLTTLEEKIDTMEKKKK